MAFLVAGISTLVSEMRWTALSPEWRGLYSRLPRRGLSALSRIGNFSNFLEALKEMPWGWRNKAQGDATVPLTVRVEQGAAMRRGE
jgi:hypothetical protein